MSDQRVTNRTSTASPRSECCPQPEAPIRALTTGPYPATASPGRSAIQWPQIWEGTVGYVNLNPPESFDTAQFVFSRYCWMHCTSISMPTILQAKQNYPALYNISPGLVLTGCKGFGSADMKMDPCSIVSGLRLHVTSPNENQLIGSKHGNLKCGSVPAHSWNEENQARCSCRYSEHSLAFGKSESPGRKLSRGIPKCWSPSANF